MYCDAVFEGGGVKGIAFIGAIQEAEERGYRFKRLGGTSAGALIASLLAAGYTGKELEQYVDQLSFSSLLDRSELSKIPYLGNLLSLFFQNGIFQGKRLETWIKEMLLAKGVHTFGDLPANKLKIVASDISRGKFLILPDDLPAYNLDPYTFPIHQAVRMSCSIPYFLQPVTLRYRGKKVYIVDGALLSNYPIWLFDKKKDRHTCPTIGFRLKGAEQVAATTPIYGPVSMLFAIFSTMMEAHDRLYIKEKDAARTMFIPVENVRATDFQINAHKKKRLIQLGREEARRFFNQWNYNYYLEKYEGVRV